MSAAAQATLTFAKDYSTWSYKESAADYAAKMTGLVAAPELAVLNRRLRGRAGQGARRRRLIELRAEQERRPGRRAKLLGIGLASYVEITTANSAGETAKVEVRDDGTATVYTARPRTARATTPPSR